MNEKKKRSRKIPAGGIVLKGIMLLLAAVVALPLYITIVNVFKTTKQISRSPMSLPIPPTFSNITGVLQDPNVNIWQMYMNSLVITVFGASICILVSAMAAYYLTRERTRLSGILYIYFLFGLMVPYVIVYVPLVTMFNKLGVSGSLPWLVMVFVSGSISFSTFMYYGFMGGISRDLEEAAIIDGAGSFTIFWKIIMPLVRPCTTTIAIFIGLSMWNDFLTPLLIGQVKTITVGIYTAIGPYASDWGSVFAYVMFATLPIAVAYIFAQKQFIAGLTAGAIKG
ncbi:MAG: carbohydrate ABC transporter permease [Eubacteriales bacterium]|nr:carbohydrate ABC transporter permease [Eubacteriales bacterium]